MTKMNHIVPHVRNALYFWRTLKRTFFCERTLHFPRINSIMAMQFTVLYGLHFTVNIK